MPTSQTTRRQPYHGTQAVGRAVSILKEFENSPSGLTATMMAARLELNRRKINRLLSVLE